jgi:hypothetical protein
VLCSYCSRSLNENTVPLILSSGNGYVARLCNPCQERWFGLTAEEWEDRYEDDIPEARQGDD